MVARQLDLTNEEVQLEGLQEELALWGDHEVVRAILSKVGFSITMWSLFVTAALWQPSTCGVREREVGRARMDLAGLLLASATCSLHPAPPSLWHHRQPPARGV
jgi:hypothetical protein